MKTRKKTIIFLIMFILVLALALGSTLAWYTAKRSVKGTMLFDKVFSLNSATLKAKQIQENYC